MQKNIVRLGSFEMTRALLLGVACVAGATLLAGNGNTGVCDSRGIPKTIKDKLEKSFQAWKIQDIGDLDDYDLGLWVKARNGECPGIAIGNFFGGSLSSYAFLLVPKDASKKGYQVLVFFKRDRNSNFEPLIVCKGSSQVREREVMRRVSAGIFIDAEGEKKVEVHQDALVVETLEASATLFYWVHGHILTLTLSE